MLCHKYTFSNNIDNNNNNNRKKLTNAVNYASCKTTFVFIVAFLFGLSTFCLIQAYGQTTYTPQAANYVIYKNGTNYVSHSFNGLTISDKDPAKVFQHTLNDFQSASSNEVKRGQVFPGSIYVAKGDYRFLTNFIGLEINQYTRLVLDPFARLIVPNGYKGYVFGFSANNTKLGSINNIIDGGIITEQSNATTTPKRLWTAFQLLSSASNDNSHCESNGILFNKILNTDIRNANIGIDLKVTGNRSFINANSFESLKMWHNFIFTNFNMTTPYDRGSECQGIFRNHFENIDGQSANARSNNFITGHGVKDIMNKENVFINVRIWDFPSVPVGNNTDGIQEHAITSDARISNVAANSSNNIIIGGIMTLNDTRNPNRSYEDNGTGTMSFDRINGISTGSNDSKIIPEIAISSTDTSPEKIGFFDVAPITQQDIGPNPSLQTIVNVLRAYGLIK